MCAERHSNADLARPARHRISLYPIDTDDRQQQRNATKHPEKNCAQLNDPKIWRFLHQIDVRSHLPLLQMTPYVDLMEKSPNLWIVKLGAVLFGVFGCIALLLAVVGVYGVKAYAVACRTREIGIRMALGAHRKDVFASIMRQGAMQTSLAITVGILLSLAAGRVLAQILYDVSPSDPFALFASSLMLAVAALLACFLPARR